MKVTTMMMIVMMGATMVNNTVMSFNTMAMSINNTVMLINNMVVSIMTTVAPTGRSQRCPCRELSSPFYHNNGQNDDLDKCAEEDHDDDHADHLSHGFYRRLERESSRIF